MVTIINNGRKLVIINNESATSTGFMKNGSYAQWMEQMPPLLIMTTLFHY
jgi:hypothetical protein